MALPTNATLQERIDRLQAELAVLRQRTNRSAALTVIAGAIVLGLLAFYFYYGYKEIRSVMDPDTLVTYAQQMLEDNLPVALREVESEIKKSSPTWAQTLSQHAVSSIPTAREQLEQHILEQADATLHEVNVMTEQHFRNVIANNRAEIEQKFKELGTSPKLAERSLLDLEDRIDKELQKEMQTQSGEFLVTVKMANVQLKKLAGGKKLTAEEEHERHALMALRRLQLDNLEPGRVPATGAPATRVKASLEVPAADKKKVE